MFSVTDFASADSVTKIGINTNSYCNLCNAVSTCKVCKTKHCHISQVVDKSRQKSFNEKKMLRERILVIAV